MVNPYIRLLAVKVLLLHFDFTYFPGTNSLMVCLRLNLAKLFRTTFLDFEVSSKLTVINVIIQMT